MTESGTGTGTTGGARLSAGRGRWALPAAFLVLGLLAGAGLTALTEWQAMPEGMLTIHESKYQDVDQTCEALKTAIEAEGFHCKGILNLNKAMAKHEVHLDRQVRVVQFGRAVSACEMLKDNPEASALMPCGFGVYEGSDGRVHISGVNRGLIGKMLGGTIASVMGDKVAPDLRKALHDHVQQRSG